MIIKILSTSSIQVLVLSLFLVSCDGNKSTRILEESSQDVVCPENFVLVPALEGYTERDFCVMKYEAKNDGSGNAISQAAGTPYVNINRLDSLAKCQTMTGYDLISNNEWQSIARNIELVESNWSTGTVEGDKGLNQGHSDTIPSEALAASGDDNKACEGTGQTCNSTTWNSQRRTHTLSNGEVIWDIAGNVFEWLKDLNIVSYPPNAYISQITDTSHPNLEDLSGDLRTAKGHFGPSGDYINLSTPGGLGNGWLAKTTEQKQGVLRGGNYLGFLDAGVFAVRLDVHNSLEKNSRIGFRCVNHPWVLEEEESTPTLPIGR